MLVNFLFLCIISSGSVFCAAKFNKKFEEILPITCMGIGMILFLFGLVGFLKAGTYFVIVASVLLYGVSFIELLKNRTRLPLFIRNFFTPGFVLFILVSGILSYALYGQLASKWDEFSHWVDIVKVMTTLDDFGTNAQSFSHFKSYPPAMTLFQYMLQKIFLMVNPGEVFNEWRVYFAYQLYFVAVLLPAYRNVKYSQPIRFCSLSAIVFFVPVVFFNDIYCSAYIDPFLAILAGAGFSMVVLYDKEEKDIFFSIYIWLVIATLVLTKDAGILFAIFLAIVYMADYCLNHHVIENRKIDNSLVINTILSLASVLIPKMLWKWKLVVTQSYINFETHIDWKILFDVFSGRDVSYRSEVLRRYVSALFSQYITVGYTHIQMSYFMLFILMTVALFLVLKFLVFKHIISREHAVLYGVISTSQLVVFIIGMCIIYIFNFSEYEALNLASFSRYLNIAYLATGLIICFLIWKLIISSSKRYQVICGIVFIAFLILITPIKKGIELIKRTNYDCSVAVRARYNVLSEKIMEACDGNDRIYIIAQEDKGIFKWVLKFNIRPNQINEEWNWSIGQPFYEGDIWTETKTAEEWRKELIADYDYVALCLVNDYFYENFSELFADPDTINENELYKVDKNSGMLYLVE